MDYNVALTVYILCTRFGFWIRISSRNEWCQKAMASISYRKIRNWNSEHHDHTSTDTTAGHDECPRRMFTMSLHFGGNVIHGPAHISSHWVLGSSSQCCQSNTRSSTNFYKYYGPESDYLNIFYPFDPFFTSLLISERGILWLYQSVFTTNSKWVWKGLSVPLQTRTADFPSLKANWMPC